MSEKRSKSHTDTHVAESPPDLLSDEQRRITYVELRSHTSADALVEVSAVQLIQEKRAELRSEAAGTTVEGKIETDPRTMEAAFDHARSLLGGRFLLSWILLQVSFWQI